MTRIQSVQSSETGPLTRVVLATARRKTGQLAGRHTDKMIEPLDYASGISATPVDVSDELFAALSEHFDEPQLVELTSVIALENFRSRFNLALGIGAAGFSEGMVCAVPEMTPTSNGEGAQRATVARGG